METNCLKIGGCNWLVIPGCAHVGSINCECASIKTVIFCATADFTLRGMHDGDKHTYMSQWLCHSMYTPRFVRCIFLFFAIHQSAFEFLLRCGSYGESAQVVGVLYSEVVYGWCLIRIRFLDSLSSLPGWHYFTNDDLSCVSRVECVTSPVYCSWLFKISESSSWILYWWLDNGGKSILDGILSQVIIIHVTWSDPGL